MLKYQRLIKASAKPVRGLGASRTRKDEMSECGDPNVSNVGNDLVQPPLSA